MPLFIAATGEGKVWQKLHLAEYGASYELNLSGLVLLRDDGAAENEGLAR